MSLQKDAYFTVLSAALSVVGAAIGMVLRRLLSGKDYSRKLQYLKLPGLVLLNLIQMVTVPYIVSNLINIIITIGSFELGPIGTFAINYIFITTLAAMSLGSIMMYLTFNLKEKELTGVPIPSVASTLHNNILDFIRQFFPKNLVSAAFENTKVQFNLTDCVLNEMSPKRFSCLYAARTEIHDRQTNVMGIMTFSIFIGVVINFRGRDGVPLKVLLKCVDEAIFFVTKAIVWYVPIGATFFIIHLLLLVDDMELFVMNLAKYTAVSIGSLMIHSCLVLPLVYFVCSRRNPFKLAYVVRKPLFISFLTGSSFGALTPVTNTLINEGGMHPVVVEFATPLGATINKDGTAIDLVISSLFIAHMFNHELYIISIMEISLVSVTGSAITMGLHRSDVIMQVAVLITIGVPVEQVAVIMFIDWLLDHFVTLTNVWGDCVGTAVLDHIYADDLLKVICDSSR